MVKKVVKLDTKVSWCHMLSHSESAWEPWITCTYDQRGQTDSEFYWPHLENGEVSENITVTKLLRPFMKKQNNQSLRHESFRRCCLQSFWQRYPIHGELQLASSLEIIPDSEFSSTLNPIANDMSKETSKAVSAGTPIIKSPRNMVSYELGIELEKDPALTSTLLVHQINESPPTLGWSFASTLSRIWYPHLRI